MVFRRALAGMVLFSLLMMPVWAEQIYVRNKPYKGPSSGRGVQTYVGLPQLAQLLGARVVAEKGGFVVTRSQDQLPGQDKSAPGVVVVEGKVVSSRTEGNQVMVSLKEAAEALGARVTVNAQLGTIDVSMPVAKIEAAPPSPSGGSASASPEAPSPLAPIYLNKKNPGSKVNIEANLVSGRVNIVEFGADW